MPTNACVFVLSDTKSVGKLVCAFRQRSECVANWTAAEKTFACEQIVSTRVRGVYVRERRPPVGLCEGQ